MLTYLNELHIYDKCNGTVCACANNGYQVLLSKFSERLGMRLTWNWRAYFLLKVTGFRIPATDLNLPVNRLMAEFFSVEVTLSIWIP